MNTDCFPDWLKKRTSDVFGPQIKDLTPYPVYLAPTPDLSSDNNNTNSALITDAKPVCHYSGFIALGSMNVTILDTIIHIIPNNVFDCIDVIAFDQNTTASSNVPPPIFLSFIRPGRISTEVPDGLEAKIATATGSLASTIGTGGPDISSLPQFIGEGIPSFAHNYTRLHIEVGKTNLPFYVWFADGFADVPSVGCNFNITWYAKNR